MTENKQPDALVKALEEILDICVNEETSPEMVSKIEKIADKALSLPKGNEVVFSGVTFNQPVIIGRPPSHDTQPDGQAKGMRWVKASERLPEIDGKYWIRYLWRGREYKTGSFFDGFRFPHHKSEIEWLDESPSPTKEECSRNGVKREGESCSLNNNCTYPSCLKSKEDYWKERCEAAEGVLSCCPIDNGNVYLSDFDENVKAWEAIKSNPDINSKLSS